MKKFQGVSSLDQGVYNTPDSSSSKQGKNITYCRLYGIADTIVRKELGNHNIGAWIQRVLTKMKLKIGCQGKMRKSDLQVRYPFCHCPPSSYKSGIKSWMGKKNQIEWRASDRCGNACGKAN